MDRTDADPEATRPPTPDDLIHIARRLNAEGARYVIVGGMAMISHGLYRTTMDVDLLVDAAPENVEKTCRALAVLADQASLEVHPDDVAHYAVVRINDEITIDLMGTACGISYENAVPDIEWRELGGVEIPFASPRLLWLMKQTYREKDALDRNFLAALMRQRGDRPPGEGGE